MKVKCIKCNREAWSISRYRKLTEYRVLSDDKVTGRDLEDYLFDSNWRKEQDVKDKGVFVRCNSCNYNFDIEDYKKLEDNKLQEMKITKKGIIFVEDKWSRFN